jgi:F-type H+-transporting ATPase subunit delta
LATEKLQAKRYSQAIFEIALERKDIDQWDRDLKTLDVLANNIEFVSVMENPKFSFENKSSLLNSQSKNIGQLAMNLAYLLTQKGKFRLLSDIYSEYRLMLDIYKGIEKAEITTAIQLEDKEITDLAEQLGSMTGKKISMTLNVDPQIIGGIIVKIGGKIIDGSTRGQLTALKNEMVGYSS